MNKQGAEFVEILRGDANLLCKDFIGVFDKILADVPCSAEGRITFSDPRSYGFWSEKNITAHARAYPHAPVLPGVRRRPCVCVRESVCGEGVLRPSVRESPAPFESLGV